MRFDALRIYWIDQRRYDIAALKQMAGPILPEKHPTFANDARQKTFFAGRAALSHLLVERCIKAQVIPDDATGFLRLVTPSKAPLSLCATVSHTESIAIAAVSETAIGIDIENKSRSVERILDRIQHPNDLAFLNEKKNPTIALWCVKEAVVKATGIGMRVPLSSINIRWQKKTILHPITIESDFELPLEKPCVTWTLRQDYCIGVCAEQKKPDLTIGFHRT